MRSLIVALLTLIAAPAAAQDPKAATTSTTGQGSASEIEAWKSEGDGIVVVPAKIRLPAHPGTLSLIKTGEASEKGKAIDNVAQYESEDRAVFGTVYVFYATYADTALATWATDRAIRERFGPNTVIASDGVVAVAGVAGGATRRIYDKGELDKGQPLASAAGFVRAGRWMVGLRVSGPTARRAEVEAAFDGLLAGMRFDGRDRPMPATPLKLAAPCPVGPEKDAKFLGDKASNSNAFLGSLLGGSVLLKDEKAGTEEMKQQLSFPANGASALCVRGTVDTGKRTIDVLQPAGTDAGQIALILLDDAGGTIAVEPALLDRGFVMKHYGIGLVEVLGSFDRIPSLAQLGAILGGKDPKGGRIRSTTIFTADGKTNIQIDTSVLK